MATKKLQEVELEALDEKVRAAVEEARKRFGEGSVFVLEAEENGLTVVVRKPSRETYRRFRNERSDPAKKSGALETLFLGCLLYPTPKDFNAVLDDLPAIADTFGAQLVDKTIGAEEATVKKA